MSTIVYDAGALIAAENGVERMWALHKRALGRAIQPVIPATVLAEVWRGATSPVPAASTSSTSDTASEVG